MGQQPDLVSIIEGAYQNVEDDTEWLRGVGEATQLALDQGLGLLAFSFDASDPGHVICSEQVPIGAAPEELARSATAMNKEVPSELLARIFLSMSSFGTASELSGQGEAILEDPYYQRFAHPFGMYDFRGLIGFNPPGTGVAMGSPLPSVQQSSAAEREVWTRVAAHIAAAARLRELHRPAHRADNPLEDAEAIFNPSGKLEHAEGLAAREKGAREELAEAVRRVERARSPLRRKDGVEAIENWPSLFHGRWTIHQFEDTDGRKLLVARVNMPRPEALEDLTLAERQVVWCCAQNHPDDLIAYELGMTVGEVCQHLESVAVRFGAQSRQELCAVLAELLIEGRL